MILAGDKMPRRLAGVLVAAPVLILCGPFLLSPRHLVADDFRDYFGPHAQLAQDEFRRSGELPRWNPHQYAGVPFVGTGQNNFYYPPAALFLVMPVDRAFGILVALHLLLAAGGAYRLARSYGLGRDASAIAGIAYGLSFALIARISAGHLPNFVTVCQAPALLLLVRRAVRRPAPSRLAALSLGGALAIVGGSPQMIYQLGLLCGALALVDLRSRRAGGAPAGPAAGVLAGGIAGALALSAVHLLPLLETALASNRAAASPDLLRPFHDFDPTHLALLTVPRFFWNPGSEAWLWQEKSMYLGVLPLAVAGFAFRLRSAPVFLFAGSAVAALGEALSGLLLGWLPWYGGFRIPERVVWIVVLSLAMLAAFGWRQAVRDAATRRRVAIGIAAAAVVWGIVLAAGVGARGEALLLGAAALGAVVAVLRGAAWPFAGAVVVALDLGAAAFLELRTAPAGATAAPWYEAAIGPDRDSWRVLDLDGYKAAAVGRGFRLLRGYGHPLSPALSEAYAGAWDQSIASLDTLPAASGLRDVSVLRDLNVRWIVTGGPPSHADWRTVESRPGRGNLYEDPGARPMAFLVDAPGAVEFRREGAHRIALRVKADRAGSVAVSEAWDPGWIAERDGRPVGIGRFRSALIALEVPAGESAVTLRYSPRGWRIGRWITGAALVFGIGGALLAAARRLRRRV